MRIVNISEAKASLSKLVEQVQAGGEVVISKAGKPVAKLVRFELDVTVWRANGWGRPGLGPPPARRHPSKPTAPGRCRTA